MDSFSEGLPGNGTYWHSMDVLPYNDIAMTEGERTQVFKALVATKGYSSNLNAHVPDEEERGRDAKSLASPCPKHES